MAWETLIAAVGSTASLGGAVWQSRQLYRHYRAEQSEKHTPNQCGDIHDPYRCTLEPHHLGVHTNVATGVSWYFNLTFPNAPTPALPPAAPPINDRTHWGAQFDDYLTSQGLNRTDPVWVTLLTPGGNEYTGIIRKQTPVAASDYDWVQWEPVTLDFTPDSVPETDKDLWTCRMGFSSKRTGQPVQTTSAISCRYGDQIRVTPRADLKYEYVRT